MSSFGKPRLTRDGNTITITPPEGHHSATVLIMHGLGDSSEGFADVAEMFASQMPYTKFILPTAPTQPVTLNGGMSMNSWYDIVGLDDRAAETCAGLPESRAIISELLQKEADAGIPYNRMMLAGFSQGGALSLVTGLQLPVEKKLAGLLVMSGYLAGAKDFRLTPGVESMPILHCHGTADPMVKFSWAEKTKDEVTRQGATDYTLRSYTGLGHSLNQEEINHAMAFLVQQLPFAADLAIPVKDPSEMSVKELKTAINNAGLQRQAVGLCEKSEFVKLIVEHRHQQSS